ncbi:MAG: VWA domain-containing protein [Acidobacteriota bacterium]
MMRSTRPTLSLLGLALGLSPLALPYQDPPVVFKSDVSLVRVDVQAISSTNQILDSLRREDFELRESGQPREIVNFGRENLPLDLVLLLDVSGSMRPHVERIADAAHQALRVLGNEDRVALLVFDRRTRTSMPFKSNHDEIVRGFEQLLDRESFNGGTDITRALFDASDYLKRNARPEARRAIVILTDDRTEFNRDDSGVGRSLEDNNIVLSALLAPDAIGGARGGRIPTSSRRGGGMNWPGGLGGIIIGGGRIPGGNRIPGGLGGLRSAGTAEIARASGGDSMSVDNASALEDTLIRIRQSYALYFQVPEGARSGEKRSIEVRLSLTAARRYPNSQLLYRSSYSAVESAPSPAPPVITRRNPEPAASPTVTEPGSGPVPTVAAEPENKGGFRRIKPGEKP